MSILAEPDLIVNADGSIYHLCLRPDQLADTVIVAGDPDRISEISDHFDTVECRIHNREFNSHTGTYKGKRITALSTGIGTDNIDIVMHELDALINFNLKTRTQNEKRRSLDIIRIGTSGSIQPDVPVNSFGLSTHALGLDNLMFFYKNTPSVIDEELTEAFSDQVNWHAGLSKPYIVKGSERLVDLFTPFSVRGITATAPGFYGPQGRFLRLDLTDSEMIKKLQGFSYKGHRVVNFEMETSALYGLGALMGHHMVTICALIANRATGHYNAEHKTVIRQLIELVLHQISAK